MYCSSPSIRVCLFVGGLLVTSIIASLGQSVSAAELDRARLIAELRNLWDSQDSLQFECETHKLLANGQPDPSSGSARYECAFSQTSKSMRTYSRKNATAKWVLESDVKQDGQKRYNIDHLKNAANTINAVAISNQGGTKAEDSFPLNVVLWLVTPDNKPMYQLLGSSNNVSFVKSDKGIIEAKFSCPLSRNRQLKCELDSSHDWLPGQVQLLAGATEVSWDRIRFERDNGRWYPKEGIQTIKREGKEVRWEFRVGRMDINRETPQSTFKPPKQLASGVAVLDQTSKVKMTYVGGIEARKKFESVHGLTPSPSKTGNPIVATRTLRRIPWQFYLLTISATAVSAAIIIRARSKKH
jgi:hypothetical protein